MPGESPPPGALTDSVALVDVGFRYPNTETDALRDVSLHIPAGSTVAFVGENGAGKSTLVKLLCRLYEPDRGTVRIDGLPLSEIEVEAWRKCITAGFQDFARLELVAREAVGVGDLPHIDDDAAVSAALRRAAATDVVEALPGGLDTELGFTSAAGTELSSGQWQKLAARACVHEGATVARHPR